MTLVYKELTQRVYNILKSLDNKAILIDQGTNNENTTLQRRMSYIKLLNESGDKKLADFLLEKVNSKMYLNKKSSMMILISEMFNFSYDSTSNPLC